MSVLLNISDHDRPLVWRLFSKELVAHAVVLDMLRNVQCQAYKREPEG